MKKILSLSAIFILLAVSACSTTPNGDGGGTTTTPTTVQDVLKSLNGTWEEGPTDLVFSGDTVKINNDTLTLDNPNSVVLDDKIYAVYKGTLSGDATVAIFRVDGDHLHGDNDETLDKVKENFIKSPNTLRTPTGDREKSTTGRQIAKTLSGGWNSTEGKVLTFFGRTIFVDGVNSFILSPLDHVTIGDKAYAVYTARSGGMLHIFRTESDNLFSDSGSTLDAIKQKVINNPNSIATPIATRTR